MPQRVLKISVFILLLVFYASFLFNKVALPAGDDMPRHLKNGEMILKGNTSVLHSNVYSYTEPDQAVVNHHWLSGVLFFLLQKMIGWEGLVLFKIVVLLAAFAIVFRMAMRNGNFWMASALAIPAIFILGLRHTLRPEIFSFLLIAVFISVLSAFNKKPDSRKIYWLIPLQILWVNLHIFFIAGPALAAGYLLELLINSPKEKAAIKKLSIVLGALIVSCLINPNGITGALFPFQVLGDSGVEVSENHSMFYFLKTSALTNNIPALIFLASVFVFLISFIFSRRSRPVFYFLAGIVAAAAGMKLIRLMPVFALVFLPAVTANLNPLFIRFKDSLKGFRIPSITLLVATLIVLVVLKCNGAFMNYSNPGIGLTAHSNDAAAFYKTNGLKGPVFNDFDIGSYLIYHLYPQEKVFIDNRQEAYSASFFQNTYLPALVDTSAWKTISRQYNFNTLFFYFYDKGMGVEKFIFNRVHDSAWALVYADPYAVIFVRNTDANKNVIQKFHITKENVAERLDVLAKSVSVDDRIAAADIYNLVGRTDLGMQTYFDIVTRWPEQGATWMKMGERVLANDNFTSMLLSLMYLDKAISVGHKTSEVYTYSGLAYVKLGYFDKAREMLQQAVAINPDNQDAREMLNKLSNPKR